ncbi:MAG: mercury methylation ferredoxin HgcB [Smithellaceae bacterium]|nr:mercury methylation ferredoxin HgcB [Smithellaceae bacterium]
MKNRLTYLRDVTTLKFDEKLCTGCGMCLEVCPHQVLIRNNGKVSIGELDDCMECGACQMNCPVEAIHVEVGVGCAAAVINGLLGRESACCCTIESPDGESSGKATGCC